MIAAFSGLEPADGGIQASGHLAWAALAAREPCDLFVVGPAPANDVALARRAVQAKRPAGLAARVLIRRWSDTGVLFWHLGLLRLLPLVRGFAGRVVLFLHGVEAWRPPTPRVRRLLGRVDLFLTNSDFTWDRFCEFHPAARNRRHITVPLGIGEPLPAEPPAPAPEPTALMIGRLARSEDYKGHRELIAAWPRVGERVPEARLEIVGDGDLRPELEEAARAAGAADQVRFWGRVSEERKNELLAGARCLALPSRAEGFGLVYLEAMRLGRPCLVGTGDAGREVVNPPEAGLAADPADPEALAAAAVRLLAGGSEWSEWSSRARRRYELHFTAGHFQQRLLAALDL